MYVTIMYDDGSRKEFDGVEAVALERFSAYKNLVPSRMTGPLQCARMRKVELLDPLTHIWRFSRCQLNQAHPGLHSDGQVDFDNWAGL
jgi:hypothetical protein